MKINELFVIVYSMKWMSIAMHSNDIYTDDTVAQKECDSLNALEYSISHQIRHRVMRLDDYVHQYAKKCTDDVMAT